LCFTTGALLTMPATFSQCRALANVAAHC
jgi:hypothetical protein